MWPVEEKSRECRIENAEMFSSNMKDILGDCELAY